MTSTDRRRFPAIAALAVAGTALAMLFSTAEAHTPDNGPHGSEHTHFYFWRTTLTVGESSGYLGYNKAEGWGELSTGRTFNYPPWSPPHKHHFDPVYRFTVVGLYIFSTGGGRAPCFGDR